MQVALRLAGGLIRLPEASKGAFQGTARAPLLGELPKIAQEPGAELRADRFRVELYAPPGKRDVTQRHQGAVRGPGEGFERLRQTRHSEGVVAHRLEAIRNAPEQIALGMGDAVNAAMHRSHREIDHCAAVVGDGLVAQAHAEHGLRRAAQRVGRYSDVLGPLRSAGARRDHDVVECEAFHLVPGHLVVAHDEGRLGVAGAEVLREVVGEGVVVVDKERFHAHIPSALEQIMFSRGDTRGQLPFLVVGRYESGRHQTCHPVQIEAELKGACG